MDEFDVFMDAVNRKVSMDNLIEFARDDLNAKQFLFIAAGHKRRGRGGRRHQGAAYESREAVVRRD